MVDKFKIEYVKFLRDVAYQQLLKI